MDFSSRLTVILTVWGGLFLMFAVIAGIESDYAGTGWARRWWPRHLKLGLSFLVLASLSFAFNF